MKKQYLMILTFLISTILVGCDNKLEQIKDAASGIDNQADKAAKAISLDAHSIRSVQINYENYSFTINDLFKTILRDTQWEYEQKDSNHILTVKGAWKEPLFENHNLDIDKKDLKDKGKVIIELLFENDTLNEEKTKIILKYQDQIILEEKGKDGIINLYDIYIKSAKKS